MNWLTKNYAIVIVVTLLVLMVLLAVYLRGRKSKGKGGVLCNWFDIGCPKTPGNGSANPGSVNVPDAPGGSVPEGGAVPGGNVPAHIVSMSNRLSHWLNQWGDGDKRCTAYKDAMNMNDPDFISMANYYKNSNNRTLLSDIMATDTWCGTTWPFNYYEKDWSEEILNRIHRLNIP